MVTPPLRPSKYHPPERCRCHPVALTDCRATALAACTLCAAMLGYQQTGTLAPEAKEVGGERLAKVGQLELDTLGEIDNFAGSRTARACATCARTISMQSRASPALRCNRRRCKNVGRNFVVAVLELTSKVVATERALMTN